MQSDNTSAFNCRWVDGKPGTMSPHAYGTAIDINPFENRFKSNDGWAPNSWRATRSANPYAWRTNSDKVVQIMKRAGFSWTYTTNDSQHFDIIE